MANLQETIDSALMELGQFFHDSEWYGRENELVNLFAHSFLAGRDGPSGKIQSSQLGIEVAVKQLPRSGGKALVRKDLVMWNKPNETVWINGVATNNPVAIIEFKVNDDKKCATDIDWLREYTKQYPNVLGYSVCGFIKKHRGVGFTRVLNGEIVSPVFWPLDALLQKEKGRI